MEQTIQEVLKQAPMSIVLLYMVKTLYLDSKAERALMRAQIDGLTVAVTALTLAVNTLIEQVGEKATIEIEKDVTPRMKVIRDT